MVCTHCEDARRLPAPPMLAWFRAVEAMSSQHKKLMDWSSVDFVTSRDSLEKLVMWTREVRVKEFRIDTQVVGRATVLLDQWNERLWTRAGSGGHGAYSTGRAFSASARVLPRDARVWTRPSISAS
ncbi:hypothetical protein DAEQUDRAFT_726534 [Daedalea quercina L-15889]|uniref:Uncharacterized protein n=1 Tax=Daedalea quercina L-15889 TaxID=1314783 RepID=A0A165QJP0_9APHY|nr:hypothetical protein DAEQUDRAFT_726534 [Daedalea quercina L-15889]